MAAKRPAKKRTAAAAGALAALNPEMAQETGLTESFATEASEARAVPVAAPRTVEIEDLTPRSSAIEELPPSRRRSGVVTARGMRVRRLVLAALILSMVAAPLLYSGTSGTTQLTWMSFGLIYIVFGLSVNVLMGYAGQISLGHQAFVGLGGFMSAFLVSDRHMIFWLAFLLAGASGAISALLLGLIALRLKGLFLAVITLAYGLIGYFTIFQLSSFTGGGAGARAPSPPGFASPRAYVYLCMVVVVALLWVDWRFVRSKAGRATFAIRENETMAASFGINVTRYKLLAFVLSGTFAGLGGSLYAHKLENLQGSNFDFTFALTLVIMVVVGGLGSRVGVFIGSAFFALFRPILGSLFPPAALYTDLIGAVLLLLTLTRAPGGIAQQIKPITDWFGGKPFKHHGKTTSIAQGGAGVRP